MTTKINADFEKIKKEVNEILSKQNEFDRLDYFIEIRKLYNLLLALYKGGALITNSNVMGMMPPELLEDHFGRLIQSVLEVCDMAMEMKNVVITPEAEPEVKEEPEEKVPDKEPFVFKDQEIPYVV